MRRYAVKKEDDYIAFDGLESDNDNSRDWNPFDFQESEEEDEPLIEDLPLAPSYTAPPPMATVKPEVVKKEMVQKKPRRRKNRKMDSAIEDAIARMHAANRKRNVSSSGPDVKPKASRTIRIVRSSEAQLTWAELRLKRAYGFADNQKKQELDKAGRSCLLNGQKLPQMLKENVQHTASNPLGKRKQESGADKSNAYEETARKRRAIEVFQAKKAKKETEYIVGVALTKNETKKPLKPKHKIVAEEKTKPAESEKKNDFDFDEDVPSADMMMYANAEENKTTTINSQQVQREKTEADKFEPTDPSWSRVHVGGLAPRCTWRELKKAFVHCGRVKLCQVVGSRGFGFITFATQDEARNAMVDMNGRSFQGQPITVTWARDKQNPSRRGRKRNFSKRGGSSRRGKAPINFVRSQKEGGLHGNTKLLASYRPLHDGGNALTSFKPRSPTRGRTNNALPSTYRPLSPKHNPEPEQKSFDFYGFDED